MPPAWLDRNTGLPSLPMRISSAFSSPVMAAVAKPSPISTPLTALMLIRARGQFAVQLGIDRRAQAGGNAFGHHFDDGADRRAFLAHAFEIVRPRSNGAGHRGRRRDCCRFRPSSSCARSIFLRAHLHQRAADGDLAVEPVQHLARDGARRHPHRGLARATGGRRRDSRARHIWRHRCSRHGRDGICRGSRNNPWSADRHSRSAGRWACRW